MRKGVSTIAKSELHDPREVPYFELTFRGIGPFPEVALAFDIKRYEERKSNIQANRGLPYYDTVG